MAVGPPTVASQAVTVRCEGSVSSVRALRRHLETAGLRVTFGSNGVLNTDPRGPGRGEIRRWFHLVASGPDSGPICADIADGWTGSGRVSVL